MAKLKVSTSVIGFKKKAEKAWGLEEWKGWDDPDNHIIFFGLYHEFDWNVYHHLDPDIKRTVFWCGSDVLRFIKNKEWQRIMSLFPADHYCETEEEANNLRSVGIDPIIAPSFLEDPKDFPLTYKQSNNPHIWMCTHPNREKEYGVDVAKRMADRFPNYTFHIFGTDGEFAKRDNIVTGNEKNIIFYKPMENDEFNKKIQQCQMGLRCNHHEGFSEVPIKAILMGQYTATFMKFPHMWNWQNDEDLATHLEKLPTLKEPNLEAREYWVKNINNYPWITTN